MLLVVESHLPYRPEGRIALALQTENTALASAVIHSVKCIYFKKKTTKLIMT